MNELDGDRVPIAPARPLPRPTRAERAPNLIVILADDLGYGDVCAYGCESTRTPNIDALAKNGARSTQGYDTAPVCSPSRAGLMTGRYQQRFGHEFNAGGPARAAKEGLGTPLDERILLPYLQERGYANGMVGKWHLGSTEAQHPMSRGFDEFFGFLHGGNHYLDPLEQPASTRLARARGGRASTAARSTPSCAVAKPVDEPELSHRGVHARGGLAHRSPPGTEPFFLYVAYNAPHTPPQVTDKHDDRFPEVKEEGDRIYAAMVSALDDGVGAIVPPSSARASARARWWSSRATTAAPPTPSPARTVR